MIGQTLTDPERIDFTKIIAEIEAAGVTPYKLSVMLHRQMTQINRWKAGSEPRYYEGLMLVEIHREFVK